MMIRTKRILFVRKDYSSLYWNGGKTFQISFAFIFLFFSFSFIGIVVLFPHSLAQVFNARGELFAELVNSLIAVTQPPCILYMSLKHGNTFTHTIVLYIRILQKSEMNWNHLSTAVPLSPSGNDYKWQKNRKQIKEEKKTVT